VVFVPKYRRKAVYGEIRASLGGIFHELARQKECRIVEGHLLADHVHMCIEIPPKHAVASIIGFLKGKSAVAIARQFGGQLQNFTCAHFWARGYAVSTVGYELEQVKRYIREQEAEVGMLTLAVPERDNLFLCQTATAHRVAAAHSATGARTR